MSKLTSENEKLLRSYKNITKALGLSPNSREYFEFKKMMSEEELTVLRCLKKEVSQQNHLTNKINGTVSTTNRGRKKAKQADAPASEQTATTETIDNTTTSEATTELSLTVEHPLENQILNTV
jgi:hypothetical protein